MFKSWIKKLIRIMTFKDFSSESYWEDRYKASKNSGAGSYGQLGNFKIEVINNIIKNNSIESVCEWGCGDGSIASRIECKSYLGLDVSPTVINLCKNKLNSKPNFQSVVVSDYHGEKYELSMSLDVIYHLVEDNIYLEYMNNLFNSSRRFVLIYSSNTNEQIQEYQEHIRHREFTRDIDRLFPSWKLIRKINNKYPYNGNHIESSFADFYLYENQP